MEVSLKLVVQETASTAYLSTRTKGLAPIFLIVDSREESEKSQRRVNVYQTEPGDVTYNIWSKQTNKHISQGAVGPLSTVSKTSYSSPKLLCILISRRLEIK